jgi:hypothetical protein
MILIPVWLLKIPIWSVRLTGPFPLSVWVLRFNSGEAFLRASLLFNAVKPSELGGFFVSGEAFLRASPLGLALKTSQRKIKNIGI